MKKLTLILSLVFTVTLSSPSYADWEASVKHPLATSYLDFDRIRKVDGYVYYWVLGDYLKPITGMYLSSKIYHQGDCKLFRFKFLSSTFFTQPMGEGIGETKNLPYKMRDWRYPQPKSHHEYNLQKVCNH